MTTDMLPTADADAQADHCWVRRHDVLFRLQLSADYHVERERFFSTVDKVISTTVTATAMTAVIAVFGGEKALPAQVAAAATGVMSVVQLVFDPSGMARKHARLAMEFRQVIALARRAGEHWEPGTCDEFEARLADLETSEPAPMAAVVLECENRARLRANQPAVVALPWHIRVAQHWWPFNSSSLMTSFPAASK